MWFFFFLLQFHDENMENCMLITEIVQWRELLWADSNWKKIKRKKHRVEELLKCSSLDNNEHESQLKFLKYQIFNHIVYQSYIKQLCTFMSFKLRAIYDKYTELLSLRLALVWADQNISKTLSLFFLLAFACVRH